MILRFREESSKNSSLTSPKQTIILFLRSKQLKIREKEEQIKALLQQRLYLCINILHLTRPFHKIVLTVDEEEFGDCRYIIVQQ